MEVRSFLNELRSRYESKNDGEDCLSGVSSYESDVEQTEPADMDSAYNFSRQILKSKVDESNVSVSDLEASLSVSMDMEDRPIGNSMAITPTITPRSNVEDNLKSNTEDNTVTESGRRKSAILNKLTGFLYRGKNESPQPKQKSASNMNIPLNELRDVDIKSSPTISKSPSFQRGLNACKTEPLDSPGSNPLKHYQGQSNLTNDQVLQELSLRHNIDIKAMQSNSSKITATSAANINSQSANNLTYSNFQPTRQSSEIPSIFQDSNAAELTVSQSTQSVSALKPNIDLKNEKSTDISLASRKEEQSLPRSKSANVNLNQYQDNLSKTNDILTVTKENIPLSTSVRDNIANKNNLLCKPSDMPLSKSFDANLSNHAKETGTGMQIKTSRSNTTIAYDLDQMSFI